MPETSRGSALESDRILRGVRPRRSITCRRPFSLRAVPLFAFPLSASARDIVVPAGTLLQCTLNEPNLSSKTVDVGDPVLCHLRGITEFGQQAFPRGSYLIGHIEAEKDPGHFVGKGYMKIQFDR